MEALYVIRSMLIVLLISAVGSFTIVYTFYSNMKLIIIELAIFLGFLLCSYFNLNILEIILIYIFGIYTKIYWALPFVTLITGLCTILTALIYFTDGFEDPKLFKVLKISSIAVIISVILWIILPSKGVIDKIYKTTINSISEQGNDKCM